MINLFIAFVDEQQEEWKGWVYAAILVLISLGKSFFDTRSLGKTSFKGVTEIVRGGYPPPPWP